MQLFINMVVKFWSSPFKLKFLIRLVYFYFPHIKMIFYLIFIHLLNIFRTIVIRVAYGIILLIFYFIYFLTRLLI